MEYPHNSREEYPIHLTEDWNQAQWSHTFKRMYYDLMISSIDWQET